MTEIQITVQLPDQVGSIEQLEAVIDAKGQQIKQQLFEHQLASLIQRQKAATEDIACPECQKRSIFKGYQQRQLKTKFGRVFFVLPRLRCQLAWVYLCVANRDAHIFLPHFENLPPAAGIFLLPIPSSGTGCLCRPPREGSEKGLITIALDVACSSDICR